MFRVPGVRKSVFVLKDLTNYPCYSSGLLCVSIVQHTTKPCSARGSTVRAQGLPRPRGFVRKWDFND